MENEIMQFRTYNFYLGSAWSSAYFKYWENKIENHASAYMK